MLSTKNEKMFYLMGNKFFRQWNNSEIGPSVISLTCAWKLLHSLSNSLQKGRNVIYLGQGVSYEDYEQLIKFTQEKGLGQVVCFKTIASYQNSEHHLTNKHHQSNILIADPIKVSDHSFRSALLIDERCQDMSDHLTGRHIAGMVITEASRQMVIAVTKKFFIPESRKDAMAFVTHKTDCEFMQFLFPLPVTIQFDIKKMRQMDCNLTAEADICFYQNNEMAAKIHFGYSSLEKEYLQKKESLLAKKYMMIGSAA